MTSSVRDVARATHLPAHLLLSASGAPAASCERVTPFYLRVSTYLVTTHLRAVRQPHRCAGEDVWREEALAAAGVLLEVVVSKQVSRYASKQVSK